MTIRFRSALVGVITASLAFFLPGLAAAEPVAPVALGGGALARFPTFATVPDSRALDAPVLLQGQLRDAAGAALAGAQVLVAAWPSNQAVSALPVGGSFDVVPLARTTTAPDGAYALRSLLTPALAALAGPDGLDIEIDVFHRDRHFVYLSQVRPNLADGSWAGSLVAGTVAPALSAGPGGALDIVLDPAQGEPLPSALRADWPPPTGPDEPPFSKWERPFGVGCVSYKKIGKPKRAWTTVATAIARNGAAMKTTYNAGATTASSTGFSFDGGLSFSINGARERTMTINAEFVRKKSKRGKVKAREYRAEVLHQTFRRVCKGNKVGEYRVHYVTGPAGLTGGVDMRKLRGPLWTCSNPDHVARAKGLDWIATENHRASTYGAAFGFKPLGGASFVGNAQSGYSSTVKVKYIFDRPTRGYWCGDTGVPASDGQRVQGFER